MEISFFSATILVAILLFLYFLLSNKRPKNFPPGPTGIPLFGNALQLGKQGYIAALKMSEKYGNIIGLKMGERWAIMLNDVDDIRNVFNNQDFSGRFFYSIFYDETSGKNTKGVIFTEGNVWKEQRGFCMKALREFGFGKKSLETSIMEALSDLIEELKKKTGQSIKTTTAFNSAGLNILWPMVAGEKLSYNDPQVRELNSLFQDALINPTTTPFYFIFPTLARLKENFPFLFPDARIFRNKSFAFFEKTIQLHRNMLREGTPNNLIDAYLEKIAETTDPTSSFYPSGSDDLNLRWLLSDLFMAGFESTNTVLCWAFFLLALHPNVQEKFFKEIQAVVGNRQVSLQDMASLPYVEATRMEIMRVSTIAPLAVPHTATKDTSFKNFFIPKNTLIVANIYACHYNPSVWGDPHNFRPERFLSADETTVIKNKHLIPFSVGKRICPGESLATDQFFLFLTNLVQVFHIGMPKDEPEHSLRLWPIQIPPPEPHNIVLEERNVMQKL